MAGPTRDDRLSVAGVFSGAFEQMVQQAVRERVDQLSGAAGRGREQTAGAGAVRRSADERLQRLEARMSSLEERAASQGALEPLEARMSGLEEGLQRALATVFPRVEALVARLERRSPGATAAPLAGELRARHQVLRQMQVVKTMMYKSGVAPSPAGEALCKAASEGSPADVQRLLASGANVNYINCRGKSPLLSAFSATVIPNLVSLLVDSGADVNAVDPDGLSVLHYAAIRGRCVSFLINAGAVVDARDGFGKTPLHCAALHGRAAVVRALLLAGADSRCRVWSGRAKNRTALDFATSRTVQQLLRL